MNRTAIQSTTLIAVWLSATLVFGSTFGGRAFAEEKKEPSAKAREAAEKVKGSLGTFSLTVFSFSVKKGDSAIRLVTDKNLVKEAPRDTFVISEDQAKAVIDGFLSLGYFDRPQTLPPAGVLPRGWYVYLITGDRATNHYWGLGEQDLDVSAHPAVRMVVKALKDDGQKMLDRLVGPKTPK